MEKIPCIVCDQELWDYVTPILEEFGYIPSNYYCGERLEDNPLLIINGFDGNLDYMPKVYNNYGLEASKEHNRELVTNVEEFLERAANLMSKTYKNKNVMKINGIEIKAGMGIHIFDESSNNLFIVFPTRKGLGVIAYGEAYHWDYLNSFLETHFNDIVAIRSAVDGEIIWGKPKEVVITMQEIADKFNIPVSQLRIKE